MRRFPGVVLELRTARANGIPHSTLRRGSSPRKWSAIDRTLALALTQYEDGLCAGCGQPRERSWNEDMDGYYEVHSRTCQACQAVANHIDGHGAPKGAESLSVTDASEPGFEPDPRMAARD